MALHSKRRTAESKEPVEVAEEEKKMKFRDFIAELQGKKNGKLFLMLRVFKLKLNLRSNRSSDAELYWAGHFGDVGL